MDPQPPSFDTGANQSILAALLQGLNAGFVAGQPQPAVSGVIDNARETTIRLAAFARALGYTVRRQHYADAIVEASRQGRGYAEHLRLLAYQTADGRTHVGISTHIQRTETAAPRRPARITPISGSARRRRHNSSQMTGPK